MSMIGVGMDGIVEQSTTQKQTHVKVAVAHRRKNGFWEINQSQDKTLTHIHQHGIIQKRVAGVGEDVKKSEPFCPTGGMSNGTGSGENSLVTPQQFNVEL